ncbi:MAG: rod shape-determining protein [Planctomycetota bacterium]|mgnify:CR=1 FL=1|nr:MAG: rod shape-determining protein [Planctomycetota bacterium]REJ97128.1 MAG: rod shape-determining protein [Planctomycetota bacterium]REK27937.1 MAG: rod shape-determining protein [Planctomycetota bacterium]REK42259.1 MAG: rod shape-determining protein [Planctomycetota bacterium]
MLQRILGFFGDDLAIDLGTANTLISVPGEGLVLNEPSVVAVDSGGAAVLSGGCAVGHMARQMLGRTPGSIDVVRPLREGVIADFQLCETMLRYFIRKAQPRRWGLGPRVIVCVPGCITPVEKRAVFNSAQRAGARQVFLLSEAKAAAIGVGLPIAEPTASMICDIGGGTTEVAVISLGDTVASGSIRVGGDAFDEAIVDYLTRNYSLRVSAAAAEQLRIDIGSAFPLPDEMSEEISGIDVISGLPRKATVTSEEIREALADPLSEIVRVVKRTIDGCTPDLAADLVDNGLVLSGGGALLRRIDRYLAEQTGLPAVVSPEALSAVARGSQLCLEQFARWRRVLESSDDDIY